MTALTTSSAETEALTYAEQTECENEPLTAIRNDSQRCGNPFCAQPITIRAQKGKRYCSDACKLDGWALRRAKALLNRVGIIRFFDLLDQV